MIQSARRALRRWPGRIARVFGYFLLLLVALAAIGALFPAFPVFGTLGLKLISPLGPWVLVLGLPVILLCLFRWRQRRRPIALIMAGLTGVVMLGAGIGVVCQVAAARAAGIPIAFGQTLWSSPPEHGGAPPVLARYGDDGGRPLNLLIYQAAARRGGALAPILVYVHGGGWGGGSIEDRARDMRFFANRGYLVISVGYTLSTKDRHPWDLAEPQVGCALIRIAAHARRFGGDPARLSLLGESAGGNLVVNVSYKAAAGQLKPACPGTLPRIAATIAPYPVLDAVRLYHNDDAIAGWFARVMTTRYTGGTPDQYPARYAAISSPNHIHRGAPPTLLLPGLADHLLPPDIADDFARRAKAAGVDIRVIGMPYGEHSFDQSEGSIGSQVFRTASLQFLARHGVAPTR